MEERYYMKNDISDEEKLAFERLIAFFANKPYVTSGVVWRNSYSEYFKQFGTSKLCSM